MRVQLLGPVEAYDGLRVLQLGGEKQRTVFAVLCAEPGRAVTRDRLAEAVWGDDLPARRNRTLATYLSNLRRATGDPIQSSSAGYRIGVTRNAVDACAFVDTVTAAQELIDVDPSTAATRLRDALDSWVGDPFRDVDGHWVLEGFVTQLLDLRAQAQEMLFEAEIASGRVAPLLSEMKELLDRSPDREKLRALVMHGLYLSGRQREALRLYDEYRDLLRRESGLDPSPELQAMETRILQQDSTLDISRSTATVALHPPNNLPSPMTSFVGRQEEVTSVASLLAASRLVTLVGPGGVGKTRLAIESAGRLLDLYADGVWLVELGPIAEPDRVSGALLDVLGLPEAVGEDSMERLVSWLAHRHTLIILDNCEHVVDRVADFVASLLSAAPGLSILATSREVLGVSGERVFHLGPLPLPASSPGAPTSLSVLMDSPAIQLFVERGKLASPDWDLTAVNSEFVIQICNRLDGLPLGIELAAARLRMLHVGQISQRLDERFDLLTGSRSQLPRQRTLEATIDWSYDLLSDDERVLFRRVAVFVGGFTLESAESVCGFGPILESRVMDLLGHLVDKSLVETEQRDEEIRYEMLETLREYARVRLGESGDSAQVQRRHAEHFLALAEQTYHLIRGGGQNDWLTRLDDELDNMRQAMTWALQTPDPEIAQLLAGSLHRYFNYRHRGTEGREWAERAIALSNEPSIGRAKALLAAGSFYRVSGENLSTPAEYLDEAIQLARDLGQHEELRWALNNRAGISGHQGDWQQAEALYQESAELGRHSGSRDPVFGAALTGMLECATVNGDYAKAVSFGREALEVAQEFGSEQGVSIVTHLLVMAHRDWGQLDVAEETLDRKAGREEELEVDVSPGANEFLRTRLALDRGNQALAVQSLQRRLKALNLVRGTPFIPGDLRLGAEVMAEAGELVTAAALMGAADAALDEIGAVRWPKAEAEAKEFRIRLTKLLGSGAFESAYEEGRGWGVEVRTERLVTAIDDAARQSPRGDPELV